MVLTQLHNLDFKWRRKSLIWIQLNFKFWKIEISNFILYIISFQRLFLFYFDFASLRKEATRIIQKPSDIIGFSYIHIDYNIVFLEVFLYYNILFLGLYFFIKVIKLEIKRWSTIQYFIFWVIKNPTKINFFSRNLRNYISKI